MLKEIKQNQEYEVTILKQDHFGQGITKIKELFVFVKEGLPQEQCKIEIVDIKKKFAKAKLKQIIIPSNARIEPFCPYYHICGGCHIMHEKYESQLTFKEQKVKELLEKFTDLKTVNIFPIIGNDPFYYRNKVIFHGKEKELGYYQEKTNQVVDIHTCVIASKEINEIYHNIQNFLKENKETVIDKLMIRTTSLKETMVVIEGKIEKEKILSYLEKVTTITINQELVKGKEYLVEEIYGVQFHIYPDSFFQVNYDMMLEMYQKVIDFYQDKNYYQVLDLYCGTGTIGMLISSYVNHVMGVEVEHSSIQSANLCKKQNQISNIEFYEGKVEDHIDSFQNIDSIIVDPPRNGLDSHTLNTILTLYPKTITYISCDPATLARDLKILSTKYQVLEVHPLDMFPNTYHVETIVFLERKLTNIFTNYTVLVNKNHPYQEMDFKDMIFVKANNIEGNLVLVEEQTYQNYLRFHEALDQMGIQVSITSGYRSLDDQAKTISELKTVYQDENKLYEKVAPVGASEHHTGLALDITISNKEQYQNRIKEYYQKEELEKREQTYQVMASICSQYGFILRYPKDKQEITGYAYEPWHFRYVGEEVAKVIMDHHLTLEEYLKKVS